MDDFKIQTAEKNIMDFVQNIVNGYSVRKEEYLQFIQEENVDINALLSKLNQARLIYQLCTLSADFISSHDIQSNDTAFKPFKRKELMDYLHHSMDDINENLKYLRKVYDDLFNMDDDDDEYQKLQNQMRESRKKYRLLNQLLQSYCKAVENYVPVTLSAPSSAEIPEQPVPPAPEMNLTEEPPIPEPVPEEETIQEELLSEQNFIYWLVSECGVMEATANQFVSIIHSIEKLYSKIFGVRKQLLGAHSAEEVKDMIQSLVQEEEYIDANRRRNNSFGNVLDKFMQFAGIFVDEPQTPPLLPKSQNQDALPDENVKILDFDDFKGVTFSKPVALVFHHVRYDANSWNELYISFLTLLYLGDYTEILRNQIGKPLYGRRIDFANSETLSFLRQPLLVSSDFYAEGNLSTIGIVKHIKEIMNLCSISTDDLSIEYEPHENTAVPETPSENAETPEPEKIASSLSDVSAKFYLKDALVAILSSESDLVQQKRRTPQKGWTPRALQDLIKKLYGRHVDIFRITKLLITDDDFSEIGKSYSYVLNPEKITDSPDTIQTQEPPQSVPDEPEDSSIDTELSEKIVEIVRENKDNLQYADGFSAYEIRVLLANEGISGIPEDKIEKLMSESDVLTEIEEGYYYYLENPNDKIPEISPVEDEIPSEIIPAENPPIETAETEIPVVAETPVPSEERRIILMLNGNIVRAYDNSDALCKICEFAINCVPFQMARIAKGDFCIGTEKIF